MSGTLTGRHVLTILLVSFGIVFAVNGVFAYVAVKSFPGLESDDAYRKGVGFNDQIARARALEDLGWSLSTRMESNGVLSMAFKDRNGAPLAVGTLSVTLFHPTAAKDDVTLIPAPGGAGRFTVPLDGVTRGQRELRVSAMAPNGQVIEFRRELWID